jgi:hypothetical protein
MKFLSFILLLLVLTSCAAQDQENDITEVLYATYEEFKENSLDKRRIKHIDLQPLIEKFANNPKFQVNKVGQSIEGRDLNLISIGNGSTDVFLWSQMHGDESTATRAIFDILNFLDSQSNVQEKREIFGQLRIHFLPMLNPDGAELYQRRNTLGIDINRDALRLQSPEGQTLKRVRDSLEADFGFNLHDQSIYYNAERTPKPATISYLAPAYNYEKDINDVRGNAMKVIGFMNDIIQKYAPGQVGRYNDDFEPRAFGDNIQKWGTSTILIESGGYAGDTEKQEIRKLNYVSILSAIYSIAKGNYNSLSLDKYWVIPENDRKLFDLKLEQVSYNLLGKDYVLDIGIHRQEIDDEAHNDFWIKGRISDQGDLSTFYGYETLSAKGYELREGRVYQQVLESIEELDEARVLSLLNEGYAYVRVSELAKDRVFSPYPVQLISENYKLPEFRLGVGQNPTFFLEQEGQLKYAVINGFLIDLESGNKSDRLNGLLLR